MRAKMKLIYHTGRSKTVDIGSDYVGGHLHLSCAPPKGAVLHPASIDDARKLIDHLEETIKLMTKPKPGPKSSTPNRNSKLMEVTDAEE